jgi:hypothetical protein
MEDQIEERWRKSSHSGNGGGNCVEISNADDTVFVRDTADREGFVLNVPASAWRAFVGKLAKG